MAMNFGKLNFAVGFNRTSAFPLDANSYFEKYDDAVKAAAGAAEVGSADSAYYIGQLIIVKDATVGVGLYQINAGKTLTKFGQASSADELASKVSALEARCATIEGKLILATAEKDGLMSKEDFARLVNVEAGAQVNKIESISVDGGEALAITEKGVNIDIATTYLKKTDAQSTYVAKEEGKGLSTNDYTGAEKAEVAKVKDKANSSTVSAIDTRVSTLEAKITGVTGAMHFVGTSTTDPMSESGATVEGHESFISGDVCLYGQKEFVYNGTAWVELGDEGSHLTKTEAEKTYKTITSYNTEKEAIDSSITAIDERVAAVEKDFLTSADRTELKGKIALKADQTALDAANNAATTLKGRVDTIEEDYLKAADKTELSTAIGKKADSTTVTAIGTRVGALETSVGKAAEGEEAATGLYKAIADEAAERGKVETRVGTLETNYGTLNTRVGSSDDAAEAEGSLFARVKQLSEDLTEGLAQAGKIDSITVDGKPVTVTDKVAVIELPKAFIQGLKEGEESLVVTDGKLELAKVSTDKLVQGVKTLVLNGGNASE